MAVYLRVDSLLGYFLVLAITNKVAMDIYTYIIGFISIE